MKTVIIIPARYGSTRLPGKPLAMIAGKTMLSRVYALALAAAQHDPDIEVVIATDDERVGNHCDELGAKWVMTPVSCPTGTDRALAAVEKLGTKPDFVLNLQGDAPLTPPDFIRGMIDAFKADPKLDVVTPVTQMTWEQLDKLRESKKTTPFSGTCVILNKDDIALWFSKNIIPAIRKEEKYREKGALSPVFRHIGLYGYSRTMLEKFVALPEGYYEALEGLEQLRVIENGYTVKAVKVDYAGRASMSGVDSPEDIIRTEELIKKHGELV